LNIACAAIDTPLKGHLFPEGSRWECDHVVALSDGGSNAEENLRCRCLGCHYPKTAHDRRARRIDES
jgi:5-methylcytosine-specific restriction endonuclease McrA